MKKLQTFSAHPEGVTSVRIGPCSGQVIATGGMDKMVNLWRIGRPACLMSIPVSKSPVQVVEFDAEEKFLAAGNQSGSIHVLSLNAGGKTKARLVGHRTACTSAAFHPLGNVLVSGSVDSTVRIWDLRNKSCVRTLSAHTDEVGCVEYSPDGRWVASGSKDGTVKLWDLQAGKLLHDFTTKTTSGEITCIRFHPEEFWLATGSVDGSVKYWDLETFRMVGTTPMDRSASVRHISFFSDSDDSEQQLISAADDGLRIWSWQPCRCVGYEPTNWDRIMDAHLSQDKNSDQQLVLCGMKDSMVSIWAVNMSRNITEQCGKPSQKLDLDESKLKDNEIETHTNTDLDESYEADFFPEDEDSTPESTQEAIEPKLKSNESKKEGANMVSRTNDTHEAIVPKLNLKSNETKEEEIAVSPSTDSPVESKAQDEGKVSDRSVPRVNGKEPKIQIAKPKRQHLVSCVSSNRESPLGLSISEFMPKSLTTVSTKVIRSETKMSLAEETLLGHEKFVSVVRERLDEVEHALGLWNHGEVVAAIEHIRASKIDSVSYDFLRVINLKNGQPPATLEMCSYILPVLAKLMDGVFENYIKLAISTCKYLLDSFQDIIISTLNIEKKSSARAGVDISREERVLRCKQCLDGFKAASTAVSSLLSSSSSEMVARTRKESEFLAAKLDKLLSQTGST